MLALKQAILGSFVGKVALGGRAFFDLLRAPQEALGTLANDQMAGHLVARLCPKNGSFLDVGAHIGSMIAEVVRHSPTATISAVEAIPDKARRIQQKFPAVKVYCCALSDREGEASFFIDLKRSGNSSLSATGTSQFGQGPPRDVREIRVPLRTLDSLLVHDQFDVVKIDVEGAELGVLKGGIRLICRSRPIIMFESGPEELLGYTKQAMWEWLTENNYSLFLPNRIAHSAPPLSLSGYIDSHEYPRHTTNYFAVPNEKISATRIRAREILKV